MSATEVVVGLTSITDPTKFDILHSDPTSGDVEAKIIHRTRNVVIGLPSTGMGAGRLLNYNVQKPQNTNVAIINAASPSGVVFTFYDYKTYELVVQPEIKRVPYGTGNALVYPEIAFLKGSNFATFSSNGVALSSKILEIVYECEQPINNCVT